MPYRFNPFTFRLDYYSTGGGAGAIGDKYVRTTRFEIISSGTSGTVTLPPNSTVVTDDFGGEVDAVVAKVDGGKPLLEPAKEVDGTVVFTSFNGSGAWVLSDAPDAYPVAILYRVRQKLSEFDSEATNIWGNTTTVETTSGAGVELTSPVFDYSPSGLLSEITYADGSSKLFAYDGQSRISVIDFQIFGSPTVIRKTFNYTGDELTSIVQTIV